MELHIKIVGGLLVTLALVHVIFPRYFNWKTELASLSLMNRQMMQVHTFYIAFVLILMGILCLAGSHDLISTPLGRGISFGLFVFWLSRLFFQLFVYSSQLWRGKRFETAVHVFFVGLWLYFSGVFFLVYRA